MDGLNEVMVNLDGSLRLVERGMKRRRIAAGVGEKLQLLHLRAEDGGGAVAELAVHAVQRAERGLAQRAVGRHQQRDIGAVRDGVALSLAVDGVGEGHIGVVEKREDLLGRLAELSGGGEQRLALARKRVLLPAAHARQGEAVMLQPLLLAEEGLVRLVVDGEQLRGEEGGRLLEVDEVVLRLRAHLLIDGIARVLVRAAEGV